MSPERVSPPQRRGPKLREPTAEQHMQSHWEPPQMTSTDTLCFTPGPHATAAEHTGNGPKGQPPTTTSHLALATAPIAPSHQTLVVLILLGQVVVKDTLSHRLQVGQRKEQSHVQCGQSEQMPEARHPGLKSCLPQVLAGCLWPGYLPSGSHLLTCAMGVLTAHTSKLL